MKAAWEEAHKSGEKAHLALRLELADHGNSAAEMKAAWDEAHKSVQEAHSALRAELAEHGNSAAEMKTSWEEAHRSLSRALDDGLSNLAAEHAKTLEELDARTYSAAEEAGKAKGTAEASKAEFLATVEKLTEDVLHAKQDITALQAAFEKLAEENKEYAKQDLEVTNQNVESNSKAIAALQSTLGHLQVSNAALELSEKAHSKDISDLRASVGGPFAGYVQQQLEPHLASLAALESSVKDLQASQGRLPEASSGEQKCRVAKREFGEEEWQQQLRELEKETERRLCDATTAQAASLMETCRQFEEEWRQEWQQQLEDFEKETTDAQSASLTETRKEIEMAMEGHISQILSVLMPERKTGAAKMESKVSDHEQACRVSQRCDEDWREQLQKLDNKTERRLHEVSDAQSAVLAETRREIETAMEGHISQIVSLLMAEKAASSAKSQEEGDFRKRLDHLQTILEAEQDTHSSLHLELAEHGKHAAEMKAAWEERRLADRGFQTQVSAELRRLAALIEAQAVAIQGCRGQAEDPAAAFQLEVDRAFFESELQEGQRRVDDALHRLESEMCGALQLTERAAKEQLDQSEVQEALQESLRKSAMFSEAHEALQDISELHEQDISELHQFVASLREAEEGIFCKLSSHRSSEEALQQELHVHQKSTAEAFASHSANHQALEEKLHGHQTSTAEILASQSAKQQSLQEGLREHQSSVAEVLARHGAHEQALHEKLCGHQASMAEFLVTTQKLEEASGRLDESHATLMYSLESERSQLDEKVRRAVADGVAYHTPEHSVDYEAAVRAELERALEPALEQAVADGIAAHAAAQAPQREAELALALDSRLEEVLTLRLGMGTPENSLKSTLKQSVGQRQGSKGSADLHQSMTSGEHYSEDSFEEDEGDSQKRSGSLCVSSSTPGHRRPTKRGSEEDAAWASEAQYLRTQHEELRQQVVQTSDEQREEISELRTHFTEELHQHVLQTSDEQREEISELREHFNTTLQCLQETTNSTAHFGRDDSLAAMTTKAAGAQAFDVVQPSSGSQQLMATDMTCNSSVEEAGLSHAVGLQVKAELQEALEVQKAVFQKVNRRMGKALGGQLNDVFKDTGRRSSSATSLDGAAAVVDELNRATGAASSGDCAAAVTAAAEQAAALQAANDAANCRELVSEMRRALLQQHEESAEVCRYAEDAMAAARAEAAAMVASRITSPGTADSSSAWAGGLHRWSSHDASGGNLRSTPAAPSRAWVAAEDVSPAALGADLADEVRSCFSDVSQHSHAQHRPLASQMARQPSLLSPGPSASQGGGSCAGRSSSTGGEMAVPSLQNTGPRGSGAGIAVQFPNRPRSLAASQSEPSLAAGLSAAAANGAAPGACRSGEAAAGMVSGQGQAAAASSSSGFGEHLGVGARGRQHQAAWVPACAPRALSSSAMRHSGARRRLGRALAQAVEIQERRSITTSGNAG
mmetsp:Transcript_150179/g.273164  ORF Transcript_150179/g.273164 Transcript_150179/m.273164 type:complete len:1453 (+) Transcript_150179:2-4360(+)